jgi:F0F1-type ATP synthase alpha subunit
MHYKLMYDRDFLGAADLLGREVICTISRVEQGTLNRAGTKKTDRKPVVLFEGKAKKFVLNATNGATIAGLYGTNTDLWRGKRITLYASTTKLKGVEVECVRVKNVEPSTRTPDTRESAPPQTEIMANLSEMPPDEIAHIKALEQSEAEAERRFREV